MKQLFVPTDFSACAQHAVDTATSLAERFASKIHLYHCMDIPRDWEAGSAPVREEARQAIQNTRLLLQNIKKKYPKLEMEIAYSGGNLLQNVKDYVKQKGIDFIVIGSHGASGKNEFFIGSNTQKIIRTVHCPVLVVKDKVPNLNFQSVVFASGFNENEKGAFLYFKDFVKHFIPEIHLVAIHTSSLFDPPYIVSKEAMEDFKALCAPFKCITHIFKDFSVEKGIRAFSKVVNADLIGISNHHRHPVKRILVGSNVEALVNHADLPVLTIDYPSK